MKKPLLATSLVVLAILAAWWWQTGGGRSAEPLEDAPSAAETLEEPAALARETPPAQAPAENDGRARREVVAPSADGPIEASPVSLRLVDRQTGEPVPHLRVEIAAAGGAREALESDAEGRIASARTYPAGPLTVDLVGELHPDDVLQTARRAAKEVQTSVQYEHAPAREPTAVELPIPVGPTFPLRLTLPAGYQAGDLLAIYTAADPKRAFDKLYSDVRDEGGPWVRFSPLAPLVGGAPELALHVGTRDGLWHGVAEVAGTAGLQPTTPLELLPRGAVEGRVVGPDGAPVPRQWVMLRRTDPPAEGGPAHRLLAALTGTDGAYQRRWMEPGPHSLKVEREGCREYEIALEVVVGRVTVADVSLASDGEARDGAVRGRVASTSRAYSGEVLVVLARPAEPGWNRTTRVGWKDEGGALVGHFAFEDLADGEYVVALHAADFAEVDPPHMIVRPSDDEIVFLLRAPGPEAVAALVFRVTDARTGAALRAYEPYLDLNPGEADWRGKVLEVAADGGAVWADYPLGTPFDYTITCRGYRPAWGDHTEARAEDGRRVIEAALEPGWGTKVVVVGPERLPIGGASVRFDGVEVGATDGGGVLRVALPATPRRVRVELDGWRMADDDGSDPDGIGFREWQRFLTVRMRHE